MIYLNNAATSYPKPVCVAESVQACLCDVPASQFRGGAQIQENTREEQCRNNLGKLLGVSDTSRIFFTSGATEALNTILGGLDMEGEILVTQTEHNSVLRPILNLNTAKRLQMQVVPCRADGEVTLEALEAAVTPKTKVLVVNHCSNVTGKVQDMDRIGKFARDHELFFLADVSQSAGCLSVRGEEWGADALAFTGHKGLLGMQGTGGFYIRPGFKLLPLKYGGTGTNSAQLTYEAGDYEYETGTRNLPGIASLCAGTDFILKKGLSEIMDTERRLMKLLYEGLSLISGVCVYGSYESCKGPVLSMNFRDLNPSDASYILWSSYGIILRSGLHCSPLIHKAMGTREKGTIRVSVSCFTTEEEIQEFLKAVGEIAASVQGRA